MAIDQLIRQALLEDGADHDLTSLATIESKRECAGSFIVKTPGIFSGSSLLLAVFQQINPKIDINIIKEDGTFVNKGDVVAGIEGRMQDILKGERVALNIIERLSGVASLTSKYVEEVRGTNCIIEASRDTTPLYREAEFKAITDAGGIVNRTGLNDHMVITKNHVYVTGTITDAIRLARKKDATSFIEVEVETEEAFIEALDAGANSIIMCDMTNDMMKRLIALPHKGVLLKASGNMTIARTRSVALLGVDAIIVNCLSLQAKGLEMKLRFLKRSFK